MTALQIALSVWFTFTLISIAAPIALGRIIRLFYRSMYRAPTCRPGYSSAHILIPVKGISRDQKRILSTLLEQDHPDYKVTFIVESPSDPATSVIEDLRSSYSHCNIVFSGMAEGCGQKNHNLIKGVESLEEEPQIIVFCDSTNEADPQWLSRLTARIDAGVTRAVTTFRAFDPFPRTIGGVCQAIYASYITLAAAVQNTPWGGGSAVDWKLFKEMNVLKAWSDTVIDDLTLGNLLTKAGVKLIMDPECLMTTKLHNQTIQGCMEHFDRQIMFPKFTNTWDMWFISALALGNMGVALVMALILVALTILGFTSIVTGLVGLVFLLGAGLIGLYLKLKEPRGIGLGSWALAFFPCMIILSYISIRSFFRDYIKWHGRIYKCGKQGKVLSQERIGD